MAPNDLLDISKKAINIIKIYFKIKLRIVTLL